MPLPASPVRATTPAAPALARFQAARSAVSWSRRPTSGASSPASSAGGSPRIGSSLAEPRSKRICSTNARVSPEGAIPSSRCSAARNDSYAPTAAALSPLSANRRIRIRAASSERGSSSKRRRASRTAVWRSPDSAAASPASAQEIRYAIAVRVPLLEHPVVVQVREQVVVADGQRRIKIATGEQEVELSNVDPDIRAVLDADSIAASHDKSGGLRAELSAQRRQGGSQAGSCAAFEHLGPEHGGHPAARVQPRVGGQPRQERPRSPARDRLEPTPVRVEAKLAHKVDAEHLPPKLLGSRLSLRPSGYEPDRAVLALDGQSGYARSDAVPDPARYDSDVVRSATFVLVRLTGV